jgi:hypothetical protein
MSEVLKDKIAIGTGAAAHDPERRWPVSSPARSSISTADC